MPGSEDRTPSPVDRPPVSRLGDELQQRVERLQGREVSPQRARALEADALRAATEKGWDQQQTGRR